MRKNPHGKKKHFMFKISSLQMIDTRTLLMKSHKGKYFKLHFSQDIQMYKWDESVAIFFNPNYNSPALYRKRDGFYDCIRIIEHIEHIQNEEAFAILL